MTWTRSLSAAVALGLFGCAGEEAPHHGHEALVATGAMCDYDGTLSYESFGRPFIAQYCTRCHSRGLKGDDRLGAPVEHDFDNIEEIRLQAGEIDGSAAGGPLAINELMPVLTPPPSIDDRMALGVWLACGAP